MSPYVVREGREADIQQCVAFALAAALERSATAWERALRRDIAHREHHLVVAEADAALAGYGRAGLFEPRRGAPTDTAPRGYYLGGVFVAPSERRRGIGAALTRARLDWISERATEAWFFTNSRNATSIGLHRQFGFEEVTRSFSFPGVTFEGGEGILFCVQLSGSARRCV